MEYTITNASNEAELDAALTFARRFFPGYGEADRSDWSRRLAEYPQLLLYAVKDSEVIGIVFGHKDDGGNVTVAPVASDARFRRLGVARALLTELEARSKAAGFSLLALGAVQDAECFYLKCSFTPFLFVQSKRPVTLDDLRRLNPGIPEVWAYDDGEDIRLMLMTDGIDRELQNRYDKAFPGCGTQTLFTKHI